MIDDEKIPEPTLRRLPWYLAYLKIVANEGQVYISSTQIAQALDISAPQIAKDLSFIKISGKTRIGYDVSKLIVVLENFLGFNRIHKAYIFGTGYLGTSLLLDKGLRQYGLEIVAGFDVKPEVVNTQINGVNVYHMDTLAEHLKQDEVEIGILTVPVNKAQAVTDYITAQGIGTIWNFTPFRIRVGDNIVVQNTSIYAHLAVMYNRLENR